ncbi:MAG: SRPBCC family protein [Actinomycetota bacterium]|nr:SRPBCC family protein [Actinomycetota bacterium]
MPYDSSAVIRSRVGAPPEQVWFALTDAHALAQWYWPAAMNPRAHSEPVVGGHFGIEAGDRGFAGEYREVDPPRRLVQSWRWSGDDRDSRVTIELTPSGSGTDLLVVHDQVDAETAEMYSAGWESCLSRLPGYLTATSPAGSR